MKHQFVMHSVRDCYGRGYNTDLICTHGLRQYIVLPRVTPPQIHIVFTQCRKQNSFEVLMPNYGPRIEGVSNYLLNAFKRMLREQFRAGYSFFHFEYDQENTT